MSDLLNRTKLFIASVLNLIATALDNLARKLHPPTPPVLDGEEAEENLFDLGRRANNDQIIPIPEEHPLGQVSFTDALNSSDFFVRHDMATKLVSWYTYENGEVATGLLEQCATVLLEQLEHTDTDRIQLLTIWNQQHDAQTIEDGATADAKEDALFAELERKTLALQNDRPNS